MLLTAVQSPIVAFLQFNPVQKVLLLLDRESKAEIALPLQNYCFQI